MCTVVIDERDDHRSKFSNLSSWKEEEHRTGIAEVTGSNPVEALIFFFRQIYHHNTRHGNFRVPYVFLTRTNNHNG